jgi:hypothetical protein
MWTRFGRLPSSFGMLPFKELLFICLCHPTKDKLCQIIFAENPVQVVALGFSGRICRKLYRKGESTDAWGTTYKCWIDVKPPNDVGTDPEIWFSSIWSRLSSAKLPSSEGRTPVNWFPFNNLVDQTQTSVMQTNLKEAKIRKWNSALQKSKREIEKRFLQEIQLRQFPQRRRNAPCHVVPHHVPAEN